jgi:selenide, water dikinase
MQPTITPVLKDIVLIGAGHAHVGVLRMFGMKPIPGVRLTLITRQINTPYSGMLPGMIAGFYSAEEAHIDTGPLAVFAGARLYHDEANGVDLDAKRVLCRNRPPVPYDLLSIDIGSTPSHGDAAGVDAHAIPVKPIDGFLERFEAARQRVLTARGRVTIAVVGAGAGGVELMLALHRRLTEEVARAKLDPSALSFRLIASRAEILPAFPKRMRQHVTVTLRKRGVEIIAGQRVAACKPGGVKLADGRCISADEVFWTTQAMPPAWLAETGLALDERGFVRVGGTLQSVSHPDVFAAGDIASMDYTPRPKSGVFAVRQGAPLARNLRRSIAAKPLAIYRAQRNAMCLLSTADGRAIGTRNGMVFEGSWVWRWKDAIDRRFMDKFNNLPEMRPAAAKAPMGIADEGAFREISATAMRCGGCGAKVGATLLSRALRAIVPAERDDVVIGLEAPDDAALVDTGGPELSLHTVDYFRAIVDDPYLFGKIAANHALGDIYAMGGVPQSALAIATVPYGREVKVEADLAMMMIGANEILREANCALVGGHTSEGAELALGFSVNGRIARDKALRKGALMLGDVLILTKPIGTGSLLAAHMRGKAKSRWTMGAIRHMTRSNRDAAGVLAAHGVHAATDVTGFGLIGHLVEMVRASNLDVVLALPAIPLLEGLKETLAMGIFSSLQPQNVRLRRAIVNLDEAGRSPLFPALFDPQTAGGLLASVPAASAKACVAALQMAGYADAAIIGEVLPRSQSLASITIALEDVSRRDDVDRTRLARLDKLQAAGEEEQNANESVS